MPPIEQPAVAVAAFVIIENIVNMWSCPEQATGCLSKLDAMSEFDLKQVYEFNREKRGLLQKVRCLSLF